MMIPWSERAVDLIGAVQNASCAVANAAAAVPKKNSLNTARQRAQLRRGREGSKSECLRHLCRGIYGCHKVATELPSNLKSILLGLYV